MALSTPIRIALGIGVAALAVAGFAVASGQLSPAKTTTNTNTLTNQITDRDQDDRDDRQESRTETRVIDAKTGQVLTEDVRRTENRSHHERDEDESHESDDDHGGRDHD
ncbi:MAG: hypothetical protein ACK5XZ_07965 [Hyphomonadaceae bacterium]|jgi:hypothetical protein|uniref:hypothetical protein n=1 Tax=Aquidulcibacter sp. TaxID=2052990 RepID=UPI0022BDD478|nr:hypothetical protein [Aquidulcibacter sp.]MCE2892510.1 hypothetical protein [Hyphomonadaceae bacterium]MCZ8207806.1 hypothetical protein [Aquidulcibacter sp.]